MSKFKVGDRVDIFSGHPYTFKGIVGSSGLGTVVGLHQTGRAPIAVDVDGVQTLKFYENEIQLITEDNMITHDQKLKALQESVTHWQEIVGEFAITSVGGERKSVRMGAEDCPLCNLGRTPDATYAPQPCEVCPLDGCGAGSLYEAVCEAETNPEAYTASKAMLARLEELLKEEEARKPEVDIRVGDIVVHNNYAHGTTAELGYIGVVRSVSERSVYYECAQRSEREGYVENFILIHRPTKGK